MKKVMMLAAMLAMVLIAAAPAFGQAGDAVADEGSTATGGDQTVQYVDCSQVQAAAETQGQYGDANATGDASSAARPLLPQQRA